MTLSASPPAPVAGAVRAGPERLLRVLVAVAIVGGPVAYLLGGLLEPAAHTSGAATIAANAAANPVTNAVHLIAFAVASYLLPIGMAGLAYLARRPARWLAMLGGLLGVLGWLPFAALTALDDLATAMAGPPGNTASAALFDRFAYDPIMNSYLFVYIAGHLLAYILLGIALRRADVLPAWAASAMIASSPVMIAAFVLPGQLEPAGLAVATTSVALLILASLPAARALAIPRRASAPGTTK